MVGGVCNGYNFNISVDEVQDYVVSKYKYTMIRDLTLVLIGFGIVLVTNADIGRLFKKYNRPEQVAIFRDNFNDVYIVRGEYPYDDTEKTCINSTHGVIKVTTATPDCINIFTGKLPKSDEIKEKLGKLDCSDNTHYVTYTIKEEWGDEWGDDYRICVFEPGVFTPTYGLNSIDETYSKFDAAAAAAAAASPAAAAAAAASPAAAAASNPTNISVLFRRFADSTNKRHFIRGLKQANYPEVVKEVKLTTAPGPDSLEDVRQKVGQEDGQEIELQPIKP